MGQEPRLRQGPERRLHSSDELERAGGGNGWRSLGSGVEMVQRIHMNPFLAAKKIKEHQEPL